MVKQAQRSPGSDPIDGEAEQRSPVGSLLRASRLRYGAELRDVATTLRIRAAYLDAIEDGRFRDLPGPAYAVGFIRAYAEHLGLDAEEVVRRYKDEAADAKKKTELEFLSPIPERGIPGGAIVFVGVLIAVVAYGGWYLSTVKEGGLADLIPPLPDRLVAMVGGADDTAKPAATPAVEDTPPSMATAAAEPTAAESADMAAGSPPSADPEMASATAAPPAEPQPAGEAPLPVAETAPAAPSEPVATAMPEPAPAVDPPVETAALPTTPTEPTAEPAADATPTLIPAPAADGSEVATRAPQPAPDPMAEPAPPPAAPAAPVEAVVETAAPAEPVVRTEAPAEPAEPVAAAAATPPPLAPAVDQVAAAADTQVAALPDSADPAAAAYSSGRVFGRENEDARIVVKARLDSWVQVRDGPANRLLLIRLLRAGDSYRVPDRPGLKLQTGNAGALEIFVDGQKVPDIGPLGSVRRDVALDTNLLQAGEAVLDR